MDQWKITHWVMSEPPAGANVWCFKLAHFISQGQFYSMQYPSGITLRLLLRGKGWIEVNGQRQAADRGSMFCAVPGTPIRMSDTPQNPWEWLELQVIGKGAEEFVESLGISRHNPLMQLPNFRAAGIFRKMLRYYQLPSGRDPYHALSLLYEFNHLCATSQREEILQDKQQQLVNDALTLFVTQENYDLNVNELAAALNVNRAALQRAFRRCLQTTPIQYLNECRLTQACTLLLSTSQPIREIALSCGFNNDKYFIRFFRHTLGRTPGQWRKINQRNE